MVAVLAACASAPLDDAPRGGADTQASATIPAAPSSAGPLPPAQPTPPATPEAADRAAGGAPLLQPRSRWVPVHWSDLPGFEADALHEAWGAWLRSCERPAPAWRALCPQVRRLSIADDATRRAWMQQALQPYRVEPRNDGADAAAGRANAAANKAPTTVANTGLLTAYYEPLLHARRQPDARHQVALFRPPADLAQRRPWFTREQIDTHPAARAALRGREIAHLADPLDALILHIQGSGRLRITEPDGRTRTVRLAFAGSNEHPYRSVGSWLLQQGLLRDASWPGITDWAQRNPQRLQEMLWTNPRYVFFREEPISAMDEADGPRGAQGVPLTAGRSIAVDPQSIPYGTPVWLASPGPTQALQRLVLAQDTGAAIVGAVRADYYMGSGDAAGELAGRLKQTLAMWVLWPR